MRLLLVEDDPALGESVAAYLRRSGFAVDVADTGELALRHAASSPYDAIVLDLGLPGVDGLHVCRALRAAGSHTRILMATARDAVEDRVLGLDTGADDYLVKPYALPELVARLRALLRRPADAVDVELRVADLALDTRSRRARRGTREIELTTKEFAVLETLMRNAGAVLTRERISEHAWDANYDPASNVIDVYVARLRRKIDHPGEPPLLETVRGAGYRLRPPVPAARAR
jgi:DNA-binding response OmpR family regulator